MQTATVPLISPKPLPDYATWSLSELIAEYYVVRAELNELDANFNQHFCLDPIYSREGRQLRKPYETKLDALIAALQPFYRQECELQRQERLTEL